MTRAQAMAARIDALEIRDAEPAHDSRGFVLSLLAIVLPGLFLVCCGGAL